MIFLQGRLIIYYSLFETFEERSILAKYKKGDNIALSLHFVQPQEYIEYFEDSAIASLRAEI
jgi:hypothetical protein